jgi:hypothetical protein
MRISAPLVNSVLVLGLVTVATISPQSGNVELRVSKQGHGEAGQVRETLCRKPIHHKRLGAKTQEKLGCWNGALNGVGSLIWGWYGGGATGFRPAGFLGVFVSCQNSPPGFWQLTWDACSGTKNRSAKLPHRVLRFCSEFDTVSIVDPSSGARCAIFPHRVLRTLAGCDVENYRCPKLPHRVLDACRRLVVRSARTVSCNSFRVVGVFWLLSQGSPLARPTLGWMIQSLRDSRGANKAPSPRHGEFRATRPSPKGRGRKPAFVSNVSWR